MIHFETEFSFKSRSLSLTLPSNFWNECHCNDIARGLSEQSIESSKLDKNKIEFECNHGQVYVSPLLKQLCYVTVTAWYLITLY